MISMSEVIHDYLFVKKRQKENAGCGHLIILLKFRFS